MTDTFAGKPISGEVTYSTQGQPVEQWSEEVFIQMADKFFELFPDAQAFVWTQYTPYFNDGDPCVFDVNGPTAVFFGDSEPSSFPENIYEPDEEEDSGWVSDYDDRLKIPYDSYEWVGNWSDGTRHKVYTVEPPAGKLAWEELITAMERGHFDNVMLQHFGDHASVMYSRDGLFLVEYFEHD
jgi:hypothetical protein